MSVTNTNKNNNKNWIQEAIPERYNYIQYMKILLCCDAEKIFDFVIYYRDTSHAEHQAHVKSNAIHQSRTNQRQNFCKHLRLFVSALTIATKSLSQMWAKVVDSAPAEHIAFF